MEDNINVIDKYTNKLLIQKTLNEILQKKDTNTKRSLEEEAKELGITVNRLIELKERYNKFILDKNRDKNHSVIDELRKTCNEMKKFLD